MGVVIIEGEVAVMGVNLGHPIVTSGIFCMRGGDAALPKLLWNFLLSEMSNLVAVLCHCIVALIVTNQSPVG